MRYQLRIMIAVIALATLGLAQVKPSPHPQTKVHLEATKCTTVPPDKTAWIPGSWSPYVAFVKICPISWQQSTALFVLSIWADDYYKTLASSAPAVKFPNPLLLSREGKKIGELPVLFPRDPPTTLEPVFVKWSGNFPHEIKLWLDDPAVLGDRYLPPLLWDAELGQFVQSNRKEETAHEPTPNH